MKCLWGKPCLREFPVSVKEAFVCLWNVSRLLYWLWKHHSGSCFCGKLPPVLTTPSMCESGGSGMKTPQPALTFLRHHPPGVYSSSALLLISSTFLTNICCTGKNTFLYKQTQASLDKVYINISVSHYWYFPDGGWKPDPWPTSVRSANPCLLWTAIKIRTSTSL